MNTEICKGHNSVKSVGRVMVLVLSKTSDNALYLYQVLPKYLIQFQSTVRWTLGWLQIVTDRCMDRLTPILHLAKAGVTKLVELLPLKEYPFILTIKKRNLECTSA